MNEITYYRLKSEYTGDYTKNCALNGTEVDNNFYVLEGRDVKNIAVDDKDIVVTLMNGDIVSAKGVLNFAKPEDIKVSVINAEFDKLNGVLKLTNSDGSTNVIDGFSTTENTDFSVCTDQTICGDGLRKSPLGVSPAAKTGQYKTVKAYINTIDGGSLPCCGNIAGDRYVTCENVSDYGYLYDYKAVHDIACELKNSEWRIPTKEDWDELLNAVEPCECEKTHGKADRNKVLGRWAGKLLKSKTMWANCDVDCDGCGCDCNSCKHKCNCNSKCEANDNTCINYEKDSCTGTEEGDKEIKCEDKCCGDHTGLDAFGFRVTPAGYADDGCNYSYFKERCAYWTATTDQENTKAYMKRFQFNKDGVYQDVIPGNYHLSLRLVKDYDGKNYFDTEEIMDMSYPTLLLPSATKGKMIWTSANFACGDESLNPMLPNDGQNITYTRHYFINEWDGFRWVRNEMRQGDTVTIADAPKGKKLVEYRVVGDDFISVNEMIYKDVMADVEVVIDDVKKELTDKIEEVSDAVKQETEDRKTEDEKLQGEIDKLEEKTDNTNKVLSDFANETNKAIGMLNDSIGKVNSNLVDAINTINGGIATEIKERKEADKVEEDARIAKDNELDEKITKEAEERKSNDDEIRGTILTNEGTEFDKDSGVLTLKSKDATNDIKVQMTFNFGEF